MAARSGRAGIVAGLAVVGLLSPLPYLWIAWRYPLSASLQTPRAGWFVSGQADWPTIFLHLLAYAVMFVLYALAVGMTTDDGRRTATRNSQLALILLVWLACSGALLWATPSGDSHDVYDYLYRGRLWNEAGVSPLATPPADAPRLPFYAYTAWKNHVDTYGPLWEYASGGVSRLVAGWLALTGSGAEPTAECPDSPEGCRVLTAYLTGYRLLAIGLTGLAGWLIYGLVRRERPEFALAGLVAWLWNPAVVLASALGAHNDGLLLVLLLGSLWALQRSRWLIGLLLLGLAAHVKVTALVWGPVYALWLWRRLGWRAMLGWGALAGALLLLLSWLLYWPLGGWETLPRMLAERMLFVANSPAQIVYRLLLNSGYGPTAEGLLFAVTRLPTYAAGLLGIALPAWLFWRASRQKAATAPALWAACAWATLLYLLVGTFWYQHWYVVWAMAPAALLPWRGMSRLLLPLLCWGAVSSNLIGDGVSRLPVMVISPVGLTAVVVATIWLPGLAAGLWLWRRRKSKAPNGQFARATKM